MTRVATWVVGLAMPCAACTLLVGTSGLADGTDAGSTPSADGGTPQGDGAAEASSDGSDGSPGDPCRDPSAVFCERFNEADATAKYPDDTDPSTYVATDDALFYSAPRAAKFVIAASPDFSPDATLTIRPPGVLKDFAVEGKVHIEKSEPGGVARLFYVNAEVDGGAEPIIIEQSGAVRSSNSVVEVGAFAKGRWIPLRVEVRASGAQALAAVEVDGVRSDVPLPQGWTPSTLLIRLGVSEADSPTTGWIVRWDDVVVKKL